MENVRIRPHEQNPNLWWVSTPSGDDVAYITHPGEGYRAWTTKGAPTPFMGKSFDTIEAALAAVAHSLG